MQNLTQVEVDSLRISLTSQHRLLMLKDSRNSLYLPLYIGSSEAESIILSLEQIEVSRPHTHDLIKLLIRELNARLTQVTITECKAGVFYAEMLLEAEDGQHRLGCRPTDAIAAALRCHAPIYAATDIMLSYGIRPEPDYRQKNDNRNEDDDDLSAFSGFFDNFKFGDDILPKE